MDFVLKDPREKEDEKKEKLPPHREELAVVPKPWNKAYVAAQEIAGDILHVTNPCMMQVSTAGSALRGQHSLCDHGPERSTFSVCDHGPERSTFSVCDHGPERSTFSV